MESDMGTTLATKNDPESHSLISREDLEALRSEMKQGIQLLHMEMDRGFAMIDERFRWLESRLTVKLGTLIVAGFGLLAALWFWS
jgi:hypothetical protein